MMGELFRIKAYEVFVRIAHGDTDQNSDIRDAPDEAKFKEIGRETRRQLNRGKTACQTADAMIEEMGGAFNGASVDVCSDDPTKSVIIFYNDRQ
nr:F46 [uncultured bacterium]